MRRGLVSPSVNMSRPLPRNAPALTTPQSQRAPPIMLMEIFFTRLPAQYMRIGTKVTHRQHACGIGCAYRKTRALRSLSLWGMKSRLILSLEGEACAQILLSTHTYFS